MNLTAEQLDWLQRPTILSPSLGSIEGTHDWEMRETYRVSLPPPHFPLRLVLPKFWRYDRSSIPEIIPKWILDRDDCGTLAPGPHDAGFQCKGRFLIPPPDDLVSPHIVTVVNTIDGGEMEIPTSLRVSRDEVDMWFILYLLRQRIKPRWKMVAAYRVMHHYWGLRELVGLSKRW